MSVATPSELFALLNRLGIKHSTYEHPAVFTSADTAEWVEKVPGLHCKNLFMENKEGRRFLIVMPAFERAQLNRIFQQLGAGRLSFCKPDTMLPTLGVPPGHATPLALMNETAKDLTVAVDEKVAVADLISVHPLHNAASTVLSGADLMAFLRHCGFEPTLIDTH